MKENEIHYIIPQHRRGIYRKQIPFIKFSIIIDEHIFQSAKYYPGLNNFENPRGLFSGIIKSSIAGYPIWRISILYLIIHGSSDPFQTVVLLPPRQE